NNNSLRKAVCLLLIGYAFSSAMYKINNTGVAKLAARPLNNTGVEQLSAFSYGGACVSACERAASFATPAELKA
ncbi:MAG: hypothetical protein P9X24_05315, partial [Candidatus Hatepunaea meridiana]|nr:hypothetical protein [Candidatus Hatepunaea meridiana]